MPSNNLVYQQLPLLEYNGLSVFDNSTINVTYKDKWEPRISNITSFMDGPPLPCHNKRPREGSVGRSPESAQFGIASWHHRSSVTMAVGVRILVIFVICRGLVILVVKLRCREIWSRLVFFDGNRRWITSFALFSGFEIKCFKFTFIKQFGKIGSWSVFANVQKNYA